MPACGMCGVFIGGASRRMEGFPKALLRFANGETLLARTLRTVREAGLTPVLVGDPSALVALEPAASGVPVCRDVETGVGPLGGLVALLACARGAVIAIACDMPGLEANALRALANDPATAKIVAPRRDGRWEPLFARYDAARVLPFARARLAAGERSLQGVLDAAGAVAFDHPLDAGVVLHDVDTVLDAARAGLSRSHA